ncbi:MAG TPA: multicopper oxidase domain-containing protein [Ktedonobacteraceae bacterium]
MMTSRSGSYTYRFIAKDAGTYWYHSHQFSHEETTSGPFGLIIVDPRTPTYHVNIGTQSGNSPD